MGFMRSSRFFFFFISAVYTENVSFNIFLVNDVENALLKNKLDEAVKYIGENYDSSLNLKNIFVENIDPVLFLTRLCEDYENSLRNLKTPHLIFDTTKSRAISKAVKFFTKSLALPTVSTSVDENDARNPWNKLDQNEMQYLLQVFSPADAIVRLSKDIILRQNMTNVAIIHDDSLGQSETFSEEFQNIGIRNIVERMDSEINMYEKLSNYTKNFSNFFIVGSLHNIKFILEIAESQSVFQNKFSWYVATLEEGMVDCTTCTNAKIIFMQPSRISSHKYFANDIDILSNDFYFHLLIGSFISLRDSSYVSSWVEEDFRSCKTYDGNNTPFRKNIDLKQNFQKHMAHYRPFSMHVNFVHFTHGKINESVLIGQWNAYTDKEMKLVNEHLWSELVEKEVLRVVVVEQKPFIFLDDSHPRGFDGYLIDMIEEIGALLGFDYYIELASDNTIGDLDDDGQWNGLMRDILDSRADLGLASIPVTSTREKVVDFTVPYYGPVGSIILMKLFRTKTSLNKFIDVMETEVWICILAAFLMTSLLIWIFDKYQPSNKSNRRVFSMRESLWFCFISMTPQGTGDSPNNISGRIIAVFWWLFSFIIIASYTANLSAILTVSLLVNPVENFEDLEKEYKLEYAPLNGSSTMQYFSRMMHIESLFHQIWKNITFAEENTEVQKSQYSVWTYPISGRYTNIWTSMMAAGFPETMDEVLERIRKSKSPTDGFVFIGDATDCRYLELTNCDLQTIGEEFSSKTYAIAVPEGSPLKKRLDFAITKLMQERVLEQLQMKWWDQNPARKRCEKTENQFDGIGLGNIGGAFILLLMGVGSATITLVIEFYWFQHIKRAMRCNRRDGAKMKIMN